MTTPPPLPPTPMPYETPSGDPGGAGITFDWNTFFRALVIVLATIAILLLVVPQFATTFEEFKSDLPATTKALLALQRSTSGGWWVALLAIPPGLGFLVAQFGPMGRRLARMAIVLGFGAFVAFVALGIFQPMLSLIDEMSGSRK